MLVVFWYPALVDNEDIKAANLHSYSDGSLENDLPMQQLSELFNVNHFIVSQVNPHSALLTFMATANVWSNPLFTSVVGYMRFLTAQTRDWIKNVVNLFVFRSLAPIWSTRRGFAQVRAQQHWTVLHCTVLHCPTLPYTTLHYTLRT